MASLPSTGIPLRRKFAAVRLSQLITTAWTLVSEKNGKSYAIRYTPDGLLVKERSANSSSLVLKASSNLMDATTKEDASKMVNSVAIYDSSGNFIRRPQPYHRGNRGGTRGENRAVRRVLDRRGRPHLEAGQLLRQADAELSKCNGDRQRGK